jgi:hypothetical protein
MFHSQFFVVKAKAKKNFHLRFPFTSAVIVLFFRSSIDPKKKQIINNTVQERLKALKGH